MTARRGGRVGIRLISPAGDAVQEGLGRFWSYDEGKRQGKHELGLVRLG
ncbi:hypothetical protein E2C01_077131 [Portunus trituberculatus]|uniref:Uncharacterized protein n=1 Tax=Portunus trituberculatus TaxID=210409 RepID=A0A5B7IF12_PORTR|nr:hypothetical protein [Portunus trituberculatus]